MGWSRNLIYWFYKIIWAGWRIHICATNYHYIYNISRTKPQNLTFLVSSCSCFCPIHWSQVLSRKWKVPSNGNIFCVTGPLCGQFTGHRWIPLTNVSETEFLMFSLICTWLNGWVKSRESGDLRHHRAHYDVTVMKLTQLSPSVPSILHNTTRLLRR